MGLFALSLVLIQAPPRGSLESLFKQVLSGSTTQFWTPESNHLASFIADPYELDRTKKRTTVLILKKTAHSLEAQIVAMGASAVPFLLNRLGSNTPVLTMDPGPWTGLIRHEWIDPRVRSRNQDFDWPDAFPSDTRQFLLCEGDVAFTLLGQIVNRWYWVTQGTSGCSLYQLVSDRPDRVAQLQREWQGLSKTQHRKLLAWDALNPDSDGRKALAIRRFVFYYPEKAEWLALECIRRAKTTPLISSSAPSPDISWVEALDSIKSDRLDQACCELLSVYDKSGYRRLQSLGEDQDLVHRLLRIPKRRKVVPDYVKNRIARGEDPSGYYERLIENPLRSRQGSLMWRPRLPR